MGALLLMAALWGAGRVFALDRRIVWGGIAAIWALAVLAHLALPATALARVLGGDARAWSVWGMIAGAVLAYRLGLRRLRTRAAPAASPPVPAADTLTPAEIERYARHLVLRDIGGPGQMRLRRARVLVIGAGGLGAPVCLYLAAAGVGRITVADDDRVSVSNLQRQVIFRDADHGRGKARAAASAMAALNPHIETVALDRRITGDDRDLIANNDLVIDGTDSFAARAGINAACVAAGVPLVAGSIAQWDGQVTIYDPARGAPCMACVFPEAPAPGQAAPCAEAGVVGALPGIVGSMMAMEAIKALTGAGEPLRGRMLILDALGGETRTVALSRRPDCPVCGTPPAP